MRVPVRTHMHTWIGTGMPWHICGDLRTAPRNRFSPAITWITRTELRSSPWHDDLMTQWPHDTMMMSWHDMASNFAHWTLSLVPGPRNLENSMVVHVLSENVAQTGSCYLCLVVKPCTSRKWGLRQSCQIGCSCCPTEGWKCTQGVPWQRSGTYNFLLLGKFPSVY